MRRTCHKKGFTLIELIMVIVILGVLAAYAAPRLLNTNEFDSRGLYDETMALLRFAQKSAIAQRRTVCVTFTATTATLAMSSAAATNGCATPTALTGPKGTSPAVINGRGSASYSATPAVLNFNGLGQPVDNSGVALGTQTISINNGPANITVQAVTGYVQ